MKIRTFLKVSKTRNDFMKTSFLPNSNEIILRVSALLYSQKPLEMILLKIGRKDVFIKSFQFLLAFTIIFVCLHILKKYLEILMGSNFQIPILNCVAYNFDMYYTLLEVQVVHDSKAHHACISCTKLAR